MRRMRVTCGLLFTFFGVLSADCLAGETFAVLVDGDKATCAIVTGDDPAFMEKRAANELANVMKRDSGVDVPIHELSSFDATSAKTFVLVGTPDSVPLISKLAEDSSSSLNDIGLIGDDGFVVATLEHDESKYIVLSGATGRAVYYAAVYAGEQLFLPTRRRPAQVIVRPTRLTRVPALKERAPYLLNLAGKGPEFGVDDWKSVLDGLARESHNRVYFWWQSLYKPRDFPDRRNVDGGTDRIKMSNDDVNELARYAHELGMEFLIGGGAFNWGGAAALVKEYPETAAVKASGMCPSHPKAQELQLKFSLEMLEVIHEADGIWFEPRDEHGECLCDVCQKPVDEFGSEQYGQSEMKFLKDFCRALWDKRPEAQVAWLVELYKPSKMHSEDPAYFQRISEIQDPRLHWIVVWGAWEFPGPRGEYQPAAFFSRHNVWWGKPYTMPLDDLRLDTLRAAQRGFLGYCPAFEPCFGVDYHGLAIPYPTDKLPYELTSYAFREFTWSPAQTMDEFKSKMRNRYCGPGGSEELVDDIIYLRSFAIDGSWHQNNSSTLTRLAGVQVNYDGKPLKNTTFSAALKAAEKYGASDKRIVYARLKKQLNEVRGILADELPKMDAIEARCKKLEPTASRREQRSIRLCREFIDHTQRLLRTSGFTTVEKVDEALAKLSSLSPPE